jgi:hypothetical protein
MSNKRDRQRTPGTGPKAPAKGNQVKGKVPPPTPGLDLFPPMRHSMAHGFAAASCSPVVLVLPMVFVPLLWLGLRAFGLEVFPPAMVQALSLPPIASSFDLIVSTNLFGTGGFAGILFLLGLTVVRAVVWSVLVGLLDEALEYHSVSRLGLLRGLNAFRAILLYCYVWLGVMLVGNVVVGLLGPGIGSSVSILSLVAGLMFLGFAPMSAVRSGIPSMEALQRSIRGARLPGWPRQMMFSVLYFFFAAFLLPIFNPGFSTVTANPAPATFAYVLMGTFLNMVFLAAFADRWRVIEDYVPATAPRVKR